MEFTSSNNRQRILSIFTQIDDAITQVTEWNADVKTTDDYYLSSTGMQKLAAIHKQYLNSDAKGKDIQKTINFKPIINKNETTKNQREQKKK